MSVEKVLPSYDEDLTLKVDPVNWSHWGEITKKLAAVIAKTEP